MKKVTASEMQAIDRKAIEDYGIPSLLLMENAGRGVAELIYSLLPRGSRATVLVGKGNNGGDGLVAARHLHNRGFQVFILTLAPVASLKADAAANAAIVQRMKIPMLEVTESTPRETLIAAVRKSDVVVDAIFGVGLQRAPEGLFKTGIEIINEAAGPRVVAIDVPSGLNADTGEILDVAVRASHTATLALPKKGLFEKDGPECAGRIGVFHIGIPRELLTNAGRP